MALVKNTSACGHSSVAKIVVVTLRRDDNVITAERDDHFEYPTVISLPILTSELQCLRASSFPQRAET